MIFSQTLGKSTKGSDQVRAVQLCPPDAPAVSCGRTEKSLLGSDGKTSLFLINASAQSLLIASAPGGDGYGVSSKSTLRFCPQEGFSWLLKHKGVLISVL